MLTQKSLVTLNNITLFSHFKVHNYFIILISFSNLPLATSKNFIFLSIFFPFDFSSKAIKEYICSGQGGYKFLLDTLISCAAHNQLIYNIENEHHFSPDLSPFVKKPRNLNISKATVDSIVVERRKKCTSQ